MKKIDKRERVEVTSEFSRRSRTEFHYCFKRSVLLDDFFVTAEKKSTSSVWFFPSGVFLFRTIRSFSFASHYLSRNLNLFPYGGVSFLPGFTSLVTLTLSLH